MDLAMLKGKINLLVKGCISVSFDVVGCLKSKRFGIWWYWFWIVERSLMAHPFYTLAKFCKKLAFLIPWYALVCIGFACWALRIIHLRHTHNFSISQHFFYPLWRTHTCAYQKVKRYFFRKFWVFTKWMMPYIFLLPIARSGAAIRTLAEFW